MLGIDPTASADKLAELTEPREVSGGCGALSFSASPEGEAKAAFCSLSPESLLTPCPRSLVGECPSPGRR